jgi:hypothetical protein
MNSPFKVTDLLDGELLSCQHLPLGELPVSVDVDSLEGILHLIVNMTLFIKGQQGLWGYSSKIYSS